MKRPGPLALDRLLPAIFVAVATAPTSAADWFVDVAADRGIEFRHEDGRTGAKYYIETGGSGGGWIDIEGDGDPDLYLVNAAPGPGATLKTEPRNALYENRDGRFVDVTEAAGVGDPSFGTGFCVGDVDRDGRSDFLLTNYGEDRLFLNAGDGRFEEIGARAGVADGRWGASCSFGDLDGDGDLDLYVTRYVRFSYDENPYCGDRARELRAYCRPDVFRGEPDSLYINQGDGTFREEGEARGIHQGADEKGFGVVLSDLDDDADLDIYVANDGTPNRLYVNDGNGRFTEFGLLSGTALSRRGAPESGMGVALGDYDGDLDLDLVVTNYSMESNAFYRNEGGLDFSEVSAPAGLKEASYPFVGWGAALFDYDNDGDLDLAVANGHAIDNIEQFESILTYEQKNQLFENRDGVFVEVTSQAGAAWQVERASRGLAVADWNSDGRLDLLVTNTNAPAELLENRVGNAHHWVGIELVGGPANRPALGARVVLTADSRRQIREVASGGSFLVQGDLRLHFGLAGYSGAVEAEVRWPDGSVQKETLARVDRYWRIERRGNE